MLKKILALLFFSVFMLNSVGIGEEAVSDEADTLNGKKVVMIIAAANFRDDELNIPLGYFETKGADVDIASTVKTVVTGMLGSHVNPDMLYTDIKINDYDAIVFVGGTGATQYLNDTVAHKIAKDSVFNGKVLGAICLGPAILANAGVLENKKATVFLDPQTEKIFKANNVINTNAVVEKDGKIITANGPKASYKFAKEIEETILKE
jgi:protease I